MDEWRWRSAAGLGRGIEAGEIDPVALTRTFLDAIEAHEMTPRIYARLTRDRAMAEARAASARAGAGRRRSPLDGVPIAWKDLYDTAGVATEAGSRLLEGRTPTRDAAVLEAATRAGLVCLGKTHMTELAFSGIGMNPNTGSPPNVNDAGAVSGGSSSGAAASVAHGLAAGATGSDTGGSIRLPAAWNDLVGFKTSPGSMPMDGVVPLVSSLDTLGPLARSVEDAAAIWAAMAGRAAPDLRGARLAGVRLMVLDTVAMQDLEPAVAEGFEAALARLEAAGARIERRAVEAVAEADGQSGVVYAGEAYGIWRDVIEARPEVMFAPVRERFRAGATFSAPDFVAAWAIVRRCREAYLSATAGFDAVVLPASPIRPPQAEALREEDSFRRANLMTLRNTRIGNLMGLPGLSLPTGRPSVGLMLQTPPGSDLRLLRLGAAAEAALG